MQPVLDPVLHSHRPDFLKRCGLVPALQIDIEAFDGGVARETQPRALPLRLGSPAAEDGSVSSESIDR